MPGQSRFADLEPLLDRVQKPIQYVGGELNSTVKDWQCGGHGRRRGTHRPLGADVPRRLRGRVPNQGVMILYEVLNERP
jgi:hypothetical protein